MEKIRNRNLPTNKGDILLIEILKNIPILFRYFVPGYCLLTVFLLITDRTKYDIKHKILNSIILSAILHSLLSFLHCFIYPNVRFSNESIIIIEIILSLIVGFILGKFSYSQRIVDMFFKMFQKSPRSSIWQDVCLPNKNIFGKAYLKDGSCICGRIDLIESHKDNPYIVIAEYTMRDKNGDTAYETYSNNSVFMVSMSNVEKLLITYTDQKIK